MKAIQFNKATILLLFFLPFMTTFCSRTEIVEQNINNNEFETSSKINSINYLIYPTENSISGIGYTYIFIAKLTHKKIDFDLNLIIPLVFIFSIIGFVATLFTIRKYILYLSYINLGIFIFIIVLFNV